jgi:low affinity Fe/Cu permease
MKVQTSAAPHPLRHLARMRQSRARRDAGDVSGGEGDGPARDLFRKFAHGVSRIVGTPSAFIVALLALAAWGISGPVFGFSDTWQLIVNTATTIVTFLMVFLIQSTQNRDASAIHLKLDELIRATSKARDDLVALEQMSDAELESLEKDFERLRGEARRIRRENRDSKNPGGA